jgi:hypothetical protein
MYSRFFIVINIIKTFINTTTNRLFARGGINERKEQNKHTYGGTSA